MVSEMIDCLVSLLLPRRAGFIKGGEIGDTLIREGSGEGGRCRECLGNSSRCSGSFAVTDGRDQDETGGGRRGREGGRSLGDRRREDGSRRRAEG
jgi:hypothetical protein